MANPLETLISTLAFLIAGTSFLFAILQYNHPRQVQSRRVAKIARRYRSLMAAHSFNEKEVWKKVTEEYFVSLGWKGTPLSQALEIIETAWFDYSARQDIIRSNRSDVAELARRIFTVEHGKGKDLSLAETEKIYQMVETGLNAFK